MTRSNRPPPSGREPVGSGESQAYPGQPLGLPEHGPGSLARMGRRLVALLVDWLLAYGLAALGMTLGLIPLRGYSLPPAPAVPGQGDLAVVGPMARSAGDLALALDAIAGPDEAREGVGYRLALPAPRMVSSTLSGSS